MAMASQIGRLLPIGNGSQASQARNITNGNPE